MVASLVLLGTAGGACIYPGSEPARFGTSSALFVDGAVYVVDAGQGVARQLALAGSELRHGESRAEPPDQNSFERLRGIFISHLHSDHVMDLANLLLCGYFQGWPGSGVDIVGPGEWEGRHRGILGMVSGFEAVYEADLDDRTRFAGKPPLAERVRVRPVLPPERVPVRPPAVTAPHCEPFTVYQDENVRVSATLVSHGSVYPALAYRFDTRRNGSVVFSGDTSPCENLVWLAKGADLLVHEAIDPDWGGAISGGEAAARAAAPVLAKHTPVTEVGRVAEAAGVDTLVLTHLTPGDAPSEVWERGQEGFGGRLIVGRDLLQIPLPEAE